MIFAHGVGSVYQLPLPLPLYLGGAALTVLVSFVLRAVIKTRVAEVRPRIVVGPKLSQAFLAIARALAFVGFILTFIFGVADSERGFTVAPLFFWVGLIIVTACVQAICAGVWERANAWATLQELLQLGERQRDREPPWWLGPALVYALFWFELVSGRGFDPLAILIVLLVYTLFVLAFRRPFGDRWDEADPFTILFGFAGRIAPLELGRDGITFKGWLRDLDQGGPMPRSLFASIFVLLGSTTLDNVRETVQWGSFLEFAGLGSAPRTIVDSIALLVFTLPFLLPFLATMWVSGRWSRLDSVIAAARRYGWSLIPIGVAYLLAHNMPLLIAGLPQLVGQIAGRFGLDLLGQYVPSPKLVWFLEIALIVGGHVIGVLAAHRTAVATSGSHAAAVKSHSALTVLMSAFTIVTLWLLSLPVVAPS